MLFRSAAACVVKTAPAQWWSWLQRPTLGDVTSLTEMQRELAGNGLVTASTCLEAEVKDGFKLTTAAAPVANGFAAYLQAIGSCTANTRRLDCFNGTVGVLIQGTERPSAAAPLAGTDAAKLQEAIQTCLREETGASGAAGR